MIWEYDQEISELPESRLGIALSGGGIRSAAFNLGSLQVAAETGLLARANFLSCVSGGAYIPIAMAISWSESDASDLEDSLPWSNGSPEEEHFRRNSRYLSPSLSHHLQFGFSILYGALVNFVPFAIVFGLVGRIAGVAAFQVRRAGHSLWAAPVIGLTVVLGAIAIFYGFGSWGRQRFSEPVRGDNPDQESTCEKTRNGDNTRKIRKSRGLRLQASAGSVDRFERRVIYWVSVAVAAAGLLVALSILFEHLVGWVGIDSDIDGARRSLLGRIGLPPVGFIGVAYLSGLGSGLLVLLLAFWTRRYPRLQHALVTVFGNVCSAILVFPALLAFYIPSRFGIELVPDMIGVAASISILFLWSVFVLNSRHSPHRRYMARLASVFAIRRTRSSDQSVRCSQVDDPEELVLSSIGPSARAKGCDLPPLLVCAAVNLGGESGTPGRLAESFVFTERTCGGSQRRVGRFETADLERASGIWPWGMGAMSMLAISGAAIAPVMGRFTRAPLRFSMAMLNIRLGVWVPNPQAEFAERRELQANARSKRLGGLDSGHRMPQALLSIVLRARWAVADRLRSPGALYVWLEATGRTGLDRDYVYLTDGGHWENLGVVELLRRRCTSIVSFDCSASHRSTTESLAVAVSLARSELGVEIVAQPTLSRDGVAVFEYLLPAIAGHVATKGRLVVCQPRVRDDSPLDVQVEKELDGRFPTHPTSLQLFGNREFESYRALGRHLAAEAVAALRFPRLKPPLPGSNAVTQAAQADDQSVTSFKLPVD